MRLYPILICATVMTPSIAVAQTAAFKCPATRMVVEFSDGSVNTWTGKSSQNACEAINKRPDSAETVNWVYAPTAAVPANRSQAWATQVKATQLWPLVVGKKIEGRFDGVNPSGFEGTTYTTFTVDRTERITVPAGTFETFVVTRVEENKTFSYRATARQWYAPDPGMTVKWDYTDNQGRNLRGEATKITR